MQASARRRLVLRKATKKTADEHEHPATELDTAQAGPSRSPFCGAIGDCSFKGDRHENRNRRADGPKLSRICGSAPCIMQDASKWRPLRLLQHPAPAIHQAKPELLRRTLLARRHSLPQNACSKVCTTAFGPAARARRSSRRASTRPALQSHPWDWSLEPYQKDNRGAVPAPPDQLARLHCLALPSAAHKNNPRFREGRKTHSTPQLPLLNGFILPVQESERPPNSVLPTRTYQPTNQSINQSIKQSNNRSIHPSIHPSIQPASHPSITPSITQSINPSLHHSVAPSIYLSVYIHDSGALLTILQDFSTTNAVRFLRWLAVLTHAFLTT